MGKPKLVDISRQEKRCRIKTRKTKSGYRTVSYIETTRTFEMPDGYIFNDKEKG